MVKKIVAVVVGLVAVAGAAYYALTKFDFVLPFGEYLDGKKCCYDGCDCDACDCELDCNDCEQEPIGFKAD